MFLPVLAETGIISAKSFSLLSFSITGNRLFIDAT
tara:strand:+ start:863 stop:967 length:105 start_codon:yes stop_codon:yes gene_type:complete